MIQLTFELEIGIGSFTNDKYILGNIQTNTVKEWWDNYHKHLLSPNIRSIQMMNNKKLLQDVVNYPLKQLVLFCNDLYYEESYGSNKIKIDLYDSILIKGENLYYCIGNYPDYFNNDKIMICIYFYSNLKQRKNLMTPDFGENIL